MFSAGKQLIFNVQELNFFIRETFVLTVEPGKQNHPQSQSIFTVSALNETSTSVFVFLFLAKTVYSNKTN